ncbi:hypothetical protein HOY80DRAFT_1021134 [Tuber brumale]|nr:hypothetical protein HOY80DRAFT_1021134 [Tuber brumale]
MLWMEAPPLRSIYRFFMGPANSTPNAAVTPPVEATEEYTACIDALSKNGYYSKDYKPLGWVLAGGLPVNIIYEGVLEYGMVGLGAIQRARNSRFPEMNIVSLCLSTAGINGSVAMDGFGEGVINHGHKAVFSKANVNSEGLVWPLPLSGTSEAGEESTTGGTHVALSYNSSRLRLPLDMPTPLLRLLGSQSYGKGMNGDTPALGPIIGGVAPPAPATTAYIAIERWRAQGGSPGSRPAALFGPSFEPSSFSPPMLYYEVGERPRTRSLATGTSPSDFKQESGVLILVASVGKGDKIAHTVGPQRGSSDLQRTGSLREVETRYLVCIPQISELEIVASLEVVATKESSQSNKRLPIS